MNIKKAERKKINPKEIQKNYLEKIEKELVDKGVVFFDEENVNIDEQYLVLPKEITECTSWVLGEYLNAFTQKKVYLRTICGRVEIALEEAKRKYLDASSDLYKQFSNSKMSETAKERILNNDKDIKPYYREYRDLQLKKDLVISAIENVEDIIFLISREVTRRNRDFEDESRNLGRGNVI